MWQLIETTAKSGRYQAPSKSFKFSEFQRKRWSDLINIFVDLWERKITTTTHQDGNSFHFSFNLKCMIIICVLTFYISIENPQMAVVCDTSMKSRLPRFSIVLLAYFTSAVYSPKTGGTGVCSRWDRVRRLSSERTVLHVASDPKNDRYFRLKTHIGSCKNISKIKIIVLQEWWLH